MQKRCITVAAFVLALPMLTGCLNPYIYSPRPQESTESGGPPRNIRQIRYARWYIGELQEAMIQRHQLQTNARNGLIAGIAGAAAGGAIAGGYGATRDLLIGLGAGAAAGYAASTLFLDRNTTSAYLVGIQGLQCIDDEARYLQAIFIEEFRVRQHVSRVAQLATLASNADLRTALLEVRNQTAIVASAIRVREADHTRQLISAANAVAGVVNREVARNEPDPGVALQIGRQVASATQNLVTQNMQFSAEMEKATIVVGQAANRVRNAPDSNVPKTVTTQDVDEAGDANSAGSGTTNSIERSTTSTAEVNDLELALRMLLGALRNDDYRAPVCLSDGSLPIASTRGRTITMAQTSNPLTAAISGGSGRYEIEWLVPPPAGLTATIAGSTLTVRTQAALPNNYPLRINDIPADATRRPQRYDMLVIVSTEAGGRETDNRNQVALVAPRTFPPAGTTPPPVATIARMVSQLSPSEVAETYSAFQVSAPAGQPQEISSDLVGRIREYQWRFSAVISQEEDPRVLLTNGMPTRKLIEFVRRHPPSAPPSPTDRMLGRYAGRGPDSFEEGLRSSGAVARLYTALGVTPPAEGANIISPRLRFEIAALQLRYQMRRADGTINSEILRRIPGFST